MIDKVFEILNLFYVAQLKLVLLLNSADKPLNHFQPHFHDVSIILVFFDGWQLHEKRLNAK